MGFYLVSNQSKPDLLSALKTPPTRIYGTKLTPIVRSQTAPTALGTAKLTPMVTHAFPLHSKLPSATI